MRFFLRLFSLCLVLHLAAGPGRAQEDKEELEKIRHKKALQDLFQKAEEEYRQNFKMPVKTHEFWAAMKFEIAVGKFELAALHLKMMLEKQPAEEVDKDLVVIEEAEGFYAFLKLQDIRKWSDHTPFQEEAKTNVQLLLRRMTGAVEKYLSDPERINKFISRLDAPTPEERGYAFLQLQRAKQRAVPYLVETLRTHVGKPLRQRVVAAYLKFDTEFMPPLLEILKAADAKDATDIDLRVTLLDIFKKRGDKSCLPYLWHMTSSPMYPLIVREAAQDTLSYFLEIDWLKLPPPKMVLAQMAEKYYQHKMKFEPGGHRYWKWNGINLALRPDYMTPREAEEFFGLRYAREALDLDPTWKPAQIVLLNLYLERTYDQAIDKFHTKPMAPEMHNLLTSLEPSLLVTVLERALDEHNLALILPLVHILGQRGELTAARPNLGSQPRGLVRALFYPDRRVQFTAMNALIRMSAVQAPVASQRIVDLMRRFLHADGVPRALVALCPRDQMAPARAMVKELGYEPEVAETLKDAFAKLSENSDFDVIFIHPAARGIDLPHALSQFRGDMDHGRLPLILFAKKENQEALMKFTQRHANTWVLNEAWYSMGEELKNFVEEKIKVANGAKLTAEERKKFQRESIDYLWKMGRGEITGFDVRPAQDALEKALRAEDYGIFALETVARFPGREAQLRLANVVLDPRYGKLKIPAVMELNRHIHKHGMQLDRLQLLNLKELHAAAADNPELKAQLAVTLGSLRITPQQTGARLSQFTPQTPAAPEKKDEK